MLHIHTCIYLNRAHINQRVSSINKCHITSLNSHRAAAAALIHNHLYYIFIHINKYTRNEQQPKILRIFYTYTNIYLYIRNASLGQTSSKLSCQTNELLKLCARTRKTRTQLIYC